jgi:hypothetical protein
MKKKIILLTLIMAFVITAVAATPALAGSKYQTFSGLECVYVDTPGAVQITGNMLHISEQIHRNVFISDNPDVLPDGVHNFVIDAGVNLVTGKATWSGKGTFYPEGMGVWRTMGTGQVDTISSTGSSVFSGTGAYQGMTIHLKLSNGDINQCLPGAFDATHITGFIVPAGK